MSPRRINDSNKSGTGMGAEEEARRAVDPTLAFVDARLRTLLAYWQERAKDGRVPDRTDFGPETLHRLGLVANVALHDVVDGGARFRVRLVASGLTAITGQDNTGRFFDEIYPPEVSGPIIETMRWTLHERRPMRSWGTLALVGKEFIAYEALTAPLTNGGPDIAMIITVVVRRNREA
jgi:hypothetical protein